LTLFQATTLGTNATAEQTSVDDEPSAASFGSTIFYTGNFYAAMSSDSGNTFSYIDPFTEFPFAYGGFCCNQRVKYIPGWDLVAWSMMYGQDQNNNNIARLAVAKGASGLAAGEWTYWDFTAPDAQLPGNLFLDFPQIAYSSNDLYLTANADDVNGNVFAAVIFRCPLSSIAALSGSLQCTNFYLSYADTFAPVDGATTTMYWADHQDTSDLLVFAWPEDVDWPGVTATTVTHSTYPSTGYNCPSPDGHNMCGFASQFNPIHGGWLASGVLGFMWDAAQGVGGLGNFPYPYVHVVEINPTSMALIDEPVIWSIRVAWALGSVSPNGNGGLGVVAASSGGGNYPGSVVMVRDSVSPTAWQPLYVRQSNSGPPGDRWGDYLTVQPYGGNGLTWVASAYTLQGTCTDNWGPCGSVQPQFLWFGRLGLGPCTAAPAQTAAVATSQIQRSATTSGSKIFLPIVSNNACSL
jgi:hypothetical protein